MICCICLEDLCNTGINCGTCLEGQLCNQCFVQHVQNSLRNRSQVLCPVCRDPMYEKSMKKYFFQQNDFKIYISIFPSKVLCILNLLVAFSSITISFLVWYASKIFIQN